MFVKKHERCIFFIFQDDGVIIDFTSKKSEQAI